jgi:hypothetical protein
VPGVVAARVCQVHGDHRPIPLELHRHHVWPQAMGGPDVEANKVTVCPTGHANIHVAMRHLIDELPPPGSRAEVRLARTGFEQWLAAGKPGRPE